MQLTKTIQKDGLLERTPWFYLILGGGIALGFGGAIAGFVLLGHSWFQLLIAGALGILFAQVGFLAHEAGHRAVLGSRRANDRLASILGAVVGMSYSWWDDKHTRHHGSPNKVGTDPDIEVDTISFLDEDAARTRGIRRWITRRQGYLFFPLLTLEGVNLHYHSFRHLMARGPVTARWSELGMLAARFGIVLVPVFVFLPLGIACAFLGVELAVFGVYLGSTFAVNHKGMPIVAPDAKMDFFTKQVRMSRNIGGGWWASYLMGGLNFQIEHHLFPGMARPHLARAREIVQEFCRSHDVPYTETSLWRSYGIVIAYLNRVGLAARDPFECPTFTRYRRG
jgi:fatty acid desaturase